MKWHSQDLPQDDKRFCILLPKGCHVWALLVGKSEHSFERDKTGSVSMPPTVFLLVHSLPVSNVNWQRLLPPSLTFFKIFSWFVVFQEIIEFSLFHVWPFNVPVSLQFSRLNDHRKTFLQIEYWILESLLLISRVPMACSTRNQEGALGGPHPQGSASSLPLGARYW